MEALTAEEVAAMRKMLGGRPGETLASEVGIDLTVTEFSRMVATLEALMAERETCAKALTLNPLQAIDSEGQLYRWDNTEGWVKRS